MSKDDDRAGAEGGASAADALPRDPLQRDTVPADPSSPDPSLSDPSLSNRFPSEASRLDTSQPDSLHSDGSPLEFSPRVTSQSDPSQPDNSQRDTSRSDPSDLKVSPLDVSTPDASPRSLSSPIASQPDASPRGTSQRVGSPRDASPPVVSGRDASDADAVPPTASHAVASHLTASHPDASRPEASHAAPPSDRDAGVDSAASAPVERVDVVPLAPAAPDAHTAERVATTHVDIDTHEPKRESLLQRLTIERAPEPHVLPAAAIRRGSRRDFLLFGAGVAATAVGARLLLSSHIDSVVVRRGRERFLNRALTFDDNVAEALYSRNRLVPTYRRADVTPLRNNYHSPTPDPSYVPSWTLTLTGLAAGRDAVLRIEDLLRLPQHEQVTRLVCVEGWSAIAWWNGLRFADLLALHPPDPRAKWAAIEAAHDRYFVSIDLETARHPQSLLATHFNGAPLTVAHGAPLRLVVPMKLGLKNIKAITSIRYTADEPRDYWSEQGYSKYDGL
jgi:DMSO/TMAO reductase YedYZ molybdopterin-dependent catalytic subunit